MGRKFYVEKMTQAEKDLKNHQYRQRLADAVNVKQNKRIYWTLALLVITGLTTKIAISFL